MTSITETKKLLLAQLVNISRTDKNIEFDKLARAMKWATEAYLPKEGHECYIELVNLYEGERNGHLAYWDACPTIGQISHETMLEYLRPFADEANPNWRDDVAKIKLPKQGVQIGKPLPKYQNFIKSTEYLRTTEFAPLQFTVPIYLPEGLTLIFGKPKIGKSWLIMNMSIGVTGIGQCLGQTCEPGQVLYLALEDSDARLKRRMVAMLGTDKWANFDYATEWARLGAGGLDMLNAYCDDHPKLRFLAVDIFQRVRDFSKGKESVYEADYNALMGLQKIAKERRFSIAAVHHARKLSSDDPFDTASGSFGLTGACDAAICLYKAKGVRYLTGQGRDLEAFDVAVQQDEQHRYTVLGDGWKYRMDEETRGIMEVMTNDFVPAKEIAGRCGGEEKAIQARLYRMLTAGDVEKQAGKAAFRLVQYEVPDAAQGELM